MSRSAQNGTGATDDEILVSVSNLKKHFPMEKGLLGRKTEYVKAVDGVSFSIPKGQTFGLVGESGSGKTTLGKTLLRLYEPTDGTVEIDGHDIAQLSKQELRSYRKRIQIIHQDPTSSLNPRMSVKDIIETPLKIHDIGDSESRLKRVRELLETVNLSADFMYRYPAQLSGGQKQRVGIARALAPDPEFIVLDEPTSALDVSVQAQIVTLLDRLQEEFDLTYLFISHDLPLIKNVSDQVGVMYLGNLVEVGPVDSVFADPKHPYTQSLLSAIPTAWEGDEAYKPDEISLEGEIPDPSDQPSGCAFRTRCPKAFGPCSGAEPPSYDVEDSHTAKCYLYDEEHAPQEDPES